MNTTQKSISDDIFGLLTKFQRTDENRVSDMWMFKKINDVRAQLIVQKYSTSDMIDQEWLSELGLVDFHSVNAADDASIGYCGCNTISKAYLPQFITLPTKSVNQDLGVQMVLSTCGKNKFYNRNMAQWKDIPAEHTYSLFNFYYRVNTAMYVNKTVSKLRIIGILANPEEGFYIKSAPISSGSIASGTVYIVRGGGIIYDSAVVADGATFTGTSATTYAGSGKVYLYSQLTSYIETYPYPVSAEMARQITIEILTKEFNIEKAQIPDNKNDSKDDSQKS